MLPQEIDKSLGHARHLPGRVLILETARSFEDLMSLGDRHLIRQHDDTDVAQNGTQMNQPSQPA